MVYFPALAEAYRHCQRRLDLLEVEPQTLWKREGEALEPDDAAFEQLSRLPGHRLAHGVGMPLADVVDPDPHQQRAWVDTLHRINPLWVSEHLAFMRVPTDTTDPSRSEHSGFLLPPLQSEDTVALAVQRIRQLRNLSHCPVAFENPTNYLRPQPGEMPDGEFLARVALEADCGILLDVHNLYCNQLNGRGSMQSVLAALPLDRIWELHLAGGESRDGFWLDAHSGMVPPEVIALCREWIPRMPHLRALVFEIMPDYVEALKITHDDLARQLDELQSLWSLRQPRRPPQEVPSRADHSGTAAGRSFDACARWQRSLGSLVNHRVVPVGESGADLAADAGVTILQTLTGSFRWGTLAEGLQLSWRLLVMTQGERATEQLLDQYIRSHWPQAVTTDELAQFARFLQGRLASGRLEAPHLNSVLQFEMAQWGLSAEGDRPALIRFDAEPVALLQALARGHWPAHPMSAGCYELEVPRAA
jgi:uncharacterized protein